MVVKVMQMCEYVVSESKIYNANGEICVYAPTAMLSTSSLHASLTIPSSFW